MIDFQKESPKQDMATIYGYDIDDLIVVADMMREQGLTPDDIKTLVKDWRMNFQMIADCFKKELAKSINAEFGWGEQQ